MRTSEKYAIVAKISTHFVIRTRIIDTYLQAQDPTFLAG